MLSQTETGLNQGEVQLISRDAIANNPSHPCAVIHNAFDFDRVPDGRTFVFVGTESNLPQASKKGYTTLSLKSSGRNFYGTDNLAKLDSGSVDGAVLDSAILSKDSDLDPFFGSAKRVLKSGGIIQIENLDLFFKDHSPEARRSLAQSIAGKGFNVYLVADNNAYSGPLDNGLLTQNYTLYAQKIL